MKNILVILFSLLTIQSFACTDIVVGKNASVDGSVIISHTDCGDDCRIQIISGQMFNIGDSGILVFLNLSAKGRFQIFCGIKLERNTRDL